MHISPGKTWNSFRDAYSFLQPIAQEGPGKLGYGKADKTIVLNIDSTINPPFFDSMVCPTFSPSFPVLLQLLSGPRRPEVLIPKNSLIEVAFPVGQSHPFHLHGHTFDVVRPSDGEFNLKNPLRPDVYPVNGNTTFRFSGLAIAFAEVPEDSVSGPQSQIIPDDWKNLCTEYKRLSPSSSRFKGV